ncbi:MAG: phosphatidate cytidylyltransferase, partial [Nevskiales bacterium]
GKTWEGAAGGMALAALAAALAGCHLFGFKGQALAMFVLLCALVVVFSIVGDLTESMFKRHAGVKDSGTLFPGHGGVLDRLDSLFAAAPLFLAGLILLGI